MDADGLGPWGRGGGAETCDETCGGAGPEDEPLGDEDETEDLVAVVGSALGIDDGADADVEEREDGDGDGEPEAGDVGDEADGDDGAGGGPDLGVAESGEVPAERLPERGPAGEADGFREVWIGEGRAVENAPEDGGEEDALDEGFGGADEPDGRDAVEEAAEEGGHGVAGAAVLTAASCSKDSE